MDKNPLKRSKGLLRFISIFLLVVVSCQLVSGYIILPESQRLPSAIPNDGTGKVNPSWSSIPYKTTGINYTIRIVDDITRRPVQGCSKVYWLNDTYPKEHSPIRGGSIEFTIPERSEAGTYWVELKYYSRESGPEMEGRHKIFVAEKLGDLSISKFEDLNNNTHWDANEPCLQGWEFSITDPFGESYTRITNTEGVIYLPNVTTGEYVIREILKPGWYNTTAREQTVTVEEKKTTYVYFGNTIPTRIIIIKFNDTNQNNEVDNEDERLEDSEFEVTDPNGITRTYLTNETGEIGIDVPGEYAGRIYTIKEYLPAKWDVKKYTTAPIVDENRNWIKIRVERGKESTVTFLNLYTPRGTLFINKFNDFNQSQVQDDGEEGLPNWEFTVTKDGNIVATCTTNETGFCTLDLEEGKYTVTEHSKHCWNSTTPTSVETWVRADQPSEVKFGNYGFGTLVIHKFDDFNRNGVQDAGEKDLANWVFEVTQDGRTVDKCTTEEEGSCKLELPAGRYTITEELKTGWIATTPITQETEVKVCQETRVSFGNNRSIPLRITKYYDHNANGERDSGDEGIGNWGFKIKYPDGSVETVITDSDGIYERYDPPTGKYTISEQPQPCWKNRTPMVVRDVEITPDQEQEIVEFGNFEVGTLTTYKFNDTNHNGIWDTGEVPLPNGGFKVKGLNGVIDITRYTDENGGSTVELPANLRYSVSETIPVGWRNSTPHTQFVYINPCEDTPAIFGNYRHTPINIHKFNDTNGNGIRDSDEEGLAGWDFRVTGPNVDRIFTTDENGIAIFRDAVPGSYLINESMRENWISTTPQEQKIDVEEGQKVPVEFGNYLPPPPCDEIYKRLEDAPRWHKNSDENLNVTKYLDPRVVYCSDPDAGEIINVTLRVCVLAGMSPTDLVIAVDTSGSLIERGGVVLEVMRDGIIAFMEKNKAKFGENVRVGLVSWDDDIDETVNLTTDYSNVTAACKRLSSNAEEDTLYHVGLNGSIDVFSKSPRGNATKVIVLITDAKGTTDGLSSYSQLLDTSGYVIHAITVGTEQNNETVKMLENVTSQHSGVVKSVPESSDELAKELTSLTVTSIERRILNNVTVIETLPKYLRALNESYAVPPTSVQINQDGIDWSTETIVWDIGDWSSDKCWESTFKALFCCQMPADESHPIGIPKKTSEVTYTDPTNSSITRHLFIPEGGMWIRPLPWWKLVPQWRWALLGALAIAIFALATYCYMKMRRIKEPSLRIAAGRL